MTAQMDYFLPGEQFRVRAEWRRAAAPVHARARVWAPARLHFNVIDFFQMRPMIPGGGGFGFSTSGVWQEVEVAAGDGAAGPMIPTAAHLVRLFCDLVGFDASCVSVSSPRGSGKAHGGFGSNVTFNTAVLSGLNALFGTPFSVPEIWDLLTQNFVENADTDDVHIYWGMDTGVGEACLQYGGLVWVDQYARYVGSADTAGLYVVTARGDTQKMAAERVKNFGQGGQHGIGDADELESLQFCLDYQREYHDRVLAVLEKRMKPALLRNDARAFLSHGWALNEVGTYVIMEGLWRVDVLRGIMRVAREKGALYAMMSSAGPSFFAIAEGRDTAEKIAAALESEFGEFYHDFAVGEAGVKMRIDLD
jgi:predicted sugar kinase